MDAYRSDSNSEFVAVSNSMSETTLSIKYPNQIEAKDDGSQLLRIFDVADLDNPSLIKGTSTRGLFVNDSLVIPGNFFTQPGKRLQYDSLLSTMRGGEYDTASSGLAPTKDSFQWGRNLNTSGQQDAAFGFSNSISSKLGQNFICGLENQIQNGTSNFVCGGSNKIQNGTTSFVSGKFNTSINGVANLVCGQQNSILNNVSRSSFVGGESVILTNILRGMLFGRFAFIDAINDIVMFGFGNNSFPASPISGLNPVNPFSGTGRPMMTNAKETFQFVISSSSTSNTTSRLVMYGDGTNTGATSNFFNTTGADFGELFEWKDGNLQKEKRLGYMVQLSHGKIVRATNPRKVIGITSGTAGYIGDTSDFDWSQKYELNEFGVPVQYIDYLETVAKFCEDKKKPLSKGQIEEYLPHREDESLCDQLARTILGDDDYQEFVSFEKVYLPRFNARYDPKKQYTPRMARHEWEVVGLKGKIHVRDDGRAQVDDEVVLDVNNPGHVTLAPQEWTGKTYDVMKRKSPNTIVVLFN